MKYHRIIQTPKGGVEFIDDEIVEPHLGEVRVQIQAAGVSFADMLIREGIHPEARRKPFTPGVGSCRSCLEARRRCYVRESRRCCGGDDHRHRKRQEQDGLNVLPGFHLNFRNSPESATIRSFNST